MRAGVGGEHHPARHLLALDVRLLTALEETHVLGKRRVDRAGQGGQANQLVIRGLRVGKQFWGLRIGGKLEAGHGHTERWCLPIIAQTGGAGKTPNLLGIHDFRSISVLSLFR